MASTEDAASPAPLVEAPAASPCVAPPAAAAQLHAQLDRAEELVEQMRTADAALRALVPGINDALNVLLSAVFRGEVAPSLLTDLMARFAHISQLAGRSKDGAGE